MSTKVLKPVLAIGSVVAIVATGGALAPALGPLGLGLGASTALAASTAIMSIGITSGMGLLTSALGLNKRPGVSGATRDRLTANLDTLAHRKIVFGETAMATDIRYHAYTGADQEFYEQIICVASHEVQAIREVWFEGERVWTAASGVISKYASYLWVTPRLVGTSSNGIAIDSRWTASCTLTGCAYLHLKFKLTGNSKKAESPFSQQIPTRVTIKGLGARLYDPRFDSTAGGSGPQRADNQATWGTGTNGFDSSRDPGLQLLWYSLGWRINGKLALGCGNPAPRHGLNSFITASNINDEPVQKAAGGTEPRYRGDGIFSEGDDPRAVISALEAAMNGKLDDSGGKLDLHVYHNDLAAPVAHFDANDILGDERWEPTPSLDQIPNIIRGQYVDASDASLFQLVDYPETAFESVDGKDRVEPITHGHVQSAGQVQRLNKQRLQRYQYQGAYSAVFNSRAWQVSRLDPITFSHPTMGWDRKRFRVRQHGIAINGRVPMLLQEEHPDLYLWDREEKPPVQAAVPTVYDPTLAPIVRAIDEAATTAEWPAIEDPDGTKPDDNATVGAPPGTPVGDRPAEQVIADLDALDASYALVVAAVGDAADDAATARDEAAEARGEADQVRTDLAAEILRAQGAEGALYTQVVQAQTTADGATTAVTDAVTILAEADAQLAARQTTIESENDALDARITTQEATLTTALDSVASRTLTLEASVNATGLINNPEFGGLPAGPLPVAPEWSYLGPPTAAERFPLGNGRYGWRVQSAAGVETGLLSQSGAPMSRGWHIVEAEWSLIDGVASGAAVILSPRDAQGSEIEPISLPITSLKDSAGLTVNEGSTPYRRMRTATLVQLTNPSIASVEIAGANNFAALGQGTPYKQIVWQRLDVRPATPLEIEAGTSLPAVVAGLSDLATTFATETTALANRTLALEASVNTGPNRLTALRSAITDEATTRTTADTTLSNRATALESAVLTGPNSNTALRAAITDEQTTRATADTAIANRATALEASVNTGPNNLPALRAAVNDEITARVNAVGAVASRTERLEARAGAGLIGNPDFIGLTDEPFPTLPGWSYWNAQPTDAARIDVSGIEGWRINSAANLSTGLLSSSGRSMSPGWHVVEVDWTMIDGALPGAAVIISPRNASNGEVNAQVLPLTTLRDSDGKTAAQGSGYRTMRTATLARFTDPAIARVEILGANNYAGAGQGQPYKQIVWQHLDIRPATPLEIAAGVALPALEATVQHQAGVVATHDGKLGAYWEVEAIAGGRARIRARADATGSAIDMAADVIMLGNQRTLAVQDGRVTVAGDVYVEGGNLIIRGSSHMKVLGPGFGAAGEMIEWYGPLMPVAQCSRANGVSWETKAGAKKLGGFSIGQLVAGTTNPALAASVTASTGAFGSNGGTIQANASWYYRRVQSPTWPATTQGRNDFIAAMQAYGATSNGAGDWSYYGALPLGGATTLQMRRNGSNVATQTVSTGTRTITGREPEVGGAQGFATISDEAALSFTYTDPQQSTANRTYEAVLTRHGALAVPTEQTVSIATIE